MDPRTDETLLSDHLAGKSGAIDLLVRRHAGELFGFLNRFVGNAALADDLVQETFVQVHSSASSFDAARAFKPWLYTIAANKARDYLRTRGRRTTFSLDSSVEQDGPAGTAALASGDPPHEESLEGDEQRAAVRAVIAKMPEHLRMILMLGYFEQLPYSQIAEILDIPVGTVKSRLHAAVTHFAQAWKEQQPSETTVRQ